jgi:hypothetical protein
MPDRLSFGRFFVVFLSPCISFCDRTFDQTKRVASSLHYTIIVIVRGAVYFKLLTGLLNVINCYTILLGIM